MRVALLTVSDSASAGEASDLSGPLLHKLVAEGGRTVIRADILPDDRESISAWLCEVIDVRKADLVLTSGGTGLSPRDVTPEATRAVIEMEVPGIVEAIRASGLEVTPFAMLSRGIAGVRGAALIINLSGSPKAVREQWQVVEPIIDHAVDTIRGQGHHPRADAKRRESKPVSQEATPPPVKTGTASKAMNTLVGQPLSELLGEVDMSALEKEQESEESVAASDDSEEK